MVSRMHIGDRQDLATLESIQTSIWVFDIEGSTMWWANAAARRLWGAASLEELLARDYSDMSESTRVRLARYQERMARGEVITEQWTFYPLGVATTVRCTFSGIDIEHGRLAMLSEAVPTTSRQLEADALRGVEALRHTSAMISMVTPDLKLLTANPAAMQAFPDAGSETPAPTRLPERIVDADLAARVRVCIAEGEAFAADLEVETAAGRRWHSLAIKATRDPLDGSPAALIDEADITLRKSLTARLEQATATFASIVENHADGLLVIDEAGPCFANVAGEAMLAGRPALATELMAERAPAGTVRDVVLGPGRIGELRVLPTIWEGRSARLATIRDISELRRAEAARAALEERMQQTQRLDSLGRLAGGVAHDFNNLLSVILGSADLLAEDFAADDPRGEDVAAIIDAAQHGSALIRQLLAVGRQQHGTLRHTDLHALILECRPLLARVLGEHVELSIDAAAERSVVLIDPGQL
ncbi:MAG: PAS domain-containing protein, partial [Myxococcales bacterium]|nr:PAS domain-containing protein [Myxococcales bacterium]